MSNNSSFIDKIKKPLLAKAKWLALQTTNFVESAHYMFEENNEQNMHLDALPKTISDLLDKLIIKTESSSKKFKNIISLFAKIETNKMFSILEHPIKEAQKEFQKNFKEFIETRGLCSRNDLPWEQIILQFTKSGGAALFREAAYSWEPEQHNDAHSIETYNENSIKSVWKMFLEEVFDIISMCKTLNEELESLYISYEEKIEQIYRYILDKNDAYKYSLNNKGFKVSPSHNQSNIQLSQIFLIQDRAMKWSKFYLEMGNFKK